MQDKNKNKIQEMIRVNHAGEFGAQKIYNAQIKYSKNERLKKKLKNIADEELVHLNYFEKEMIATRTRPTLMRPIWDFGGSLLGAITSFMGENYVHACTEAVEEVIVEHYKQQILYLKKNKLNKEFRLKIKKFCDDEDNHKKYAESNLVDSDFKVNLFKEFTRNLTKAAIKISKKI
ncbi:MAG: 2-nonaprenyl-3-methyl-6-methoxy-1,4-benzoquinol hydroxylase [Alphaproteobacteria bacterium MarineAlpha8_Bin1]|nr:MAG: 2-nonaprenyl-3-methyl-6-methoxy-1,4-benzoquinol hydroxylase [Alphaproteobacteria bacterium MarineAlpha8_Bin1]|tara:strand:+ start:65 stop:592 length:528 start_codon:yes stop_codon:yes gene_type:complete